MNFEKVAPTNGTPVVDFCNVCMKNRDLLLFCHWKFAKNHVFWKSCAHNEKSRFIIVLPLKICQKSWVLRSSAHKGYSTVVFFFLIIKRHQILSFLLFSRKKHDVIFHQKTHTTAALQIEQKQTESVDFAEKNNKICLLFRLILSIVFAAFRFIKGFL